MAENLGPADIADRSSQQVTSTNFQKDLQGSKNPKRDDRPDSVAPAPGTTSDGTGGLLDSGGVQQVTSTNFPIDRRGSGFLPEPNSASDIPNPDVLNRGFRQPGDPGVPTSASQARTGANRQRLGNRYQRGNGSQGD